MLFTPICDLENPPTIFATFKSIYFLSVMFIQNKYHEYLLSSVILSVSCVYEIDVPYHKYFIQQIKLLILEFGKYKRFPTSVNVITFVGNRIAEIVIDHRNKPFANILTPHRRDHCCIAIY